MASPAWFLSRSGHRAGRGKKGENAQVTCDRNSGAAHVIWIQEPSEFVLEFNFSRTHICVMQLTTHIADYTCLWQF